MDKKTFKNSYFTVDVTETYYDGKGIFKTIKLDMDFTMRYPNDDKKRINTNRTSWENEAFGLSDFEKAFNKSLIFEAYSLGNVDKIGWLLNYKQILALGICHSIHKVDDHGVPFFNKEFVRDEYDFGVGIPFLSLQDKLCLLDTADKLARRLNIDETEKEEGGLLRVYCDDCTVTRKTLSHLYTGFEIKQVYSGNYKFGMQVTVYIPNSDEIHNIDD